MSDAIDVTRSRGPLLDAPESGVRKAEIRAWCLNEYYIIAAPTLDEAIDYYVREHEGSRDDCDDAYEMSPATRLINDELPESHPARETTLGAEMDAWIADGGVGPFWLGGHEE